MSAISRDTLYIFGRSTSRASHTNLKSARLIDLSRNLSFIGISKDPNFDKEKILIDHNIGMLRDNLLKVMVPT